MTPKPSHDDSSVSNSMETCGKADTPQQAGVVSENSAQQERHVQLPHSVLRLLRNNLIDTHARNKDELLHLKSQLGYHMRRVTNVYAEIDKLEALVNEQSLTLTSLRSIT